MSGTDLPIPGALALRIGRASDYHQLARFHYAPAAPASFALVLALDYLPAHPAPSAHPAHPAPPNPCTRQLIAVGVLSHPALNCRIRQRALGLDRVRPAWRWAYLNRHLRTISRVIVHPQFRGIGLATLVVRQLLAQSPTRYTEAISRLASHHPLFARAGMAGLAAGSADEPAYYLLDRATVSRTVHRPSGTALTP